jgi:hypothetical protein
MAKRIERAKLYNKLGLIASVIAVVLVLLSAALIIPRWNFTENIIVIQNQSKIMLLYGALFLSVVLGVAGFLGGLEGVANLDGSKRAMGWLAFWVGTLSSMAGIILGLCFKFYQF